MPATQIIVRVTSLAVFLTLAACGAAPTTTDAPTPEPIGESSAAATAALPDASLVTPTERLLSLAPSAAATLEAVATQTAQPSEAPALTPTDNPPTQEPSLTPASATIEWQRHEKDAGLGDVRSFRASAAASGRFVLVGDVGADYKDVLWTSDNGRDWQSVSVPGLSASAISSDVAAAGPGFVIVGSEGRDGIVLLSADGTTWELLRDPAFAGLDLFQVAAAGTNVVAFGRDDSENLYEFVSADGRTWERIDLQPGIAPESAVAVTSTASGLVVLSGDTQPEFVCRRLLVAWETTDGRTWHTLSTLPNSRGAECSGRALLAVGPLGWIATARLEVGDLTATWRTWRSDDGVSWEESTGSPFGVTDILADQAGFIAVGNSPMNCGLVDKSDFRGMTWTSPDGRAWRHVDETGWDHREIELLRRFGRTLIGIGSDWTSSPTGTVWTARLPETFADDEDAAPLRTPMDC